MNITLRPSGGRGEYEFAGAQGALHVHDLFELPIFIEILPGVAINSYSRCMLKDGKPRIRLDQPTRNAHPASLIVSVMMLPKPRRERHETHGINLIQWEQYVVQTIRIDVIPYTKRLVVRPVTVRLENGDNLRFDISFAERMARVVRVWTAAATGKDAIAEAVRSHATTFTSSRSTLSDLANAIFGLHSALGKPNGDMLALLESYFKLAPASTPPVGDISAEAGDEDFEETVQIDPEEARIDRVRQWRLSAVRGRSASKFRRNVRDAYDARCLFSGQRLPRTETTLTPGVDAAHILPWSRFDLDSTNNGICLNKQCHWAFDVGLLRLSFDGMENVYVISIPENFRLAAKNAGFDIEPFQQVVGVIPRQHLPVSEKLWPSPKYVGELNRFLEGKTV